MASDKISQSFDKKKTAEYHFETCAFCVHLQQEVKYANRVKQAK